MKSKEIDWPLENKGTNWLPIIIGASLLISIVYWLIPTSQNILKKISSPLPQYKKELKEADQCASYANMMEKHLIKAKWDARQRGVDISEEVKKIYAKGSLYVIESALSRALYGHTDAAKYDLIRYKRFCSEAEIQPNDEKIAEVEMIIRRN